MTIKRKAIAIDGPAGSGKSTVARIVAEKLEYTYIDTGAMYRAVAWQVLKNAKATGRAVDDSLINDTVEDIDVNLLYDNKVTKVIVNGQEVSGFIRTPEINRIVSTVAKVQSVRVKMVEAQRKMAERGAVIMDGRDIATNVLPNAEVKIFLTASIEERARRRYEEMQANGYTVNLEELKQDIANRDREDSERTIAPLIQAADAVLLDTTGMNIDEVVAKILSLATNN